METCLESDSVKANTQETLYSFYTADEIKSGLTFTDTDFLLNYKPFQIFSGSLHYFRLQPKQWEESIKKMKHCHLNAVCTYVPWNLHEDQPSRFNFNYNLNLKEFIETVQQQDMFLILRVGPYICAEVDFGGLPSWLLRDKNMKVRSNYTPFLDAVKRYFIELVTLIYDYQFSVNGGPVIAVQIENEFGSYGNTQTNRDDYEYMTYLKNLLLELGIKELLFTCDVPSLGLKRGSIPDVLMAANFQTNAAEELGILKNFQPNKPLMVAEFWSGWFDHWSVRHEKIPVAIYKESLKVILDYKASFNIYVFHGGTNFGFSNGATIGFPLPESPYCSTVTSYDYGALLSESGLFTEKYYATLALLKSVEKEYQRPKLILDINIPYLRIDSVKVRKYLPLSKMLPLVRKYKCNPVVMEDLGSEYGQRFGFTLYETKFKRSGSLEFCVTRGTRTVVFVNSMFVAVIENTDGFQSLDIDHTLKSTESTLWILVENLGRINFTEKKEILNTERRGLTEFVKLNEIALTNWNIYTLDFNEKFIRQVSLFKWDDIDMCKDDFYIGLYFIVLNLDDVKDSFIYSSTWNKGLVIVNGFNIGRYWKIGPQQTLFISRHILKKGLNEIFAFELHNKITSFEFKDCHVLDLTVT